MRLNFINELLEEYQKYKYKPVMRSMGHNKGKSRLHTGLFWGLPTKGMKAWIEEEERCVNQKHAK